MAFTLKPLISNWKQHPHFRRFVDPRQRLRPVSIMSMSSSSLVSSAELLSSSKIIDSHLHIWASPKEAADEFPYSPGHQPTLQGDLDFLLECMEDADVDGALIVQPINHMFDHSLVTSALKKYPTKFAGCCLANPADDGSGVYQLEHLVVEGLDLHLSEIEKLCCEFPSTTVILYHLAFCKPPTEDAERETFTSLLRLSQFPQVPKIYSIIDF